MKPAEVHAMGRSGPGFEDAVRRAVEVLSAGGVLAHPTQTVYGLGGAATESVDRVLDRLKGRDSSDFSVLRIAHSIGVIRDTLPGLVWESVAERLARCFWPGPLTLVLPLRGGGGAAVRVEGHPLTRAVLEAWGRTMGSTSLNRSGEDPAWSSRRARECLRRMPEPDVPTLFLDAGDLAGPPPSTLVSLTGETPVVLRLGAVPLDAIERCISGGGD